ncbi:MAG TPA: membrane protein insertase YidC, partial [Alphaproteobacteria bacterium]|nr:membrane protein insertase YidC [Alphaproteobacteria bacterium]
MNDQRNFIIAIVLSIAVLFAFQYFMPSAPKKAEPQTAPQSTQQLAMPQATESQWMTREEALKKAPHRLQIQSSSVKGSINLEGALFDDLTLLKYHETVDPKSPNIVILAPENSLPSETIEQIRSRGKYGKEKITIPSVTYFTRFGWKSTPETLLPNEKTLWQPNGLNLTPQTPVTLSWDNGQGLTFHQLISIDNHYMFTITQKVTNTGTMPVSLAPQGFLARQGEPTSSGFFILHEGPVGVFDGKLSDPSFDDLAKTGTHHNPKGKGWFGLTDKYWLGALVPDPKAIISSFYTRQGTGEDTLISAQYQRDPLTLEPGKSIEVTDHFFAGAKVLNLL